MWFSVIQNGRRRSFWKKKKASNAIQSDFWSSKMAASSHFVKKKLLIDLKWREMWSKVIFGHQKWPPAAILWKKKVAYWSEMLRNAIKSDFRSSKMGGGRRAHHNGQPVNHSGIYTVFALGQIHQFYFYIGIRIHSITNSNTLCLIYIYLLHTCFLYLLKNSLVREKSFCDADLAKCKMWMHFIDFYYVFQEVTSVLR